MDHVLEFYEVLVDTSTPMQPLDPAVISTVSVLTLSIGAALVRPVTSQEVKEAPFNIDTSKAPGPDGYNAFFFRSVGSNWGD